MPDQRAKPGDPPPPPSKLAHTAPGAPGALVELAREVVARARASGFALAGVCEARPSDYAEHVRAWLAAGMQGDMAYLAEHVAQRLDPTNMLPGVRAILAVADLYVERGQGAVREPIRTGFGRVARYARGDDYHRVMKRRLHALCDALRLEHPGHEFRACVDIEPNLEREHAQRAGLGWVGRNTLLIHPDLGSYFSLGLVLTTLPLAPPPEQPAHTDHCGACTRCIDACPTGAIAPAGPTRAINAQRCVSYLTLETRDAIPADFHAPIGDMLAGCDICQEVCPHNAPRRAPTVASPRSEYTPRVPPLPILEVLNWSPEQRSERLRGAAIKRATLTMWRRNAIVAAGNAILDPALAPHEREALLARVRELALDEHATVRETACATLARLGA